MVTRRDQALASFQPTIALFLKGKPGDKEVLQVVVIDYLKSLPLMALNRMISGSDLLENHEAQILKLADRPQLTRKKNHELLDLFKKEFGPAIVNTVYEKIPKVAQEEIELGKVSLEEHKESFLVKCQALLPPKLNTIGTLPTKQELLTFFQNAELIDCEHSPA